MNYQEEGELEVDVTTLLKMVPVSELSDAGSIFDKAMETLPEAIISRFVPVESVCNPGVFVSYCQYERWCLIRLLLQSVGWEFLVSGERRKQDW